LLAGIAEREDMKLSFEPAEVSPAVAKASGINIMSIQSFEIEPDGETSN
jgi:hypothetical protein